MMNKMYKILTSTDSADSAMKLRDSIEKILGMESKTILVSKNSKNCSEYKTLMRYGCQYGELFPEPEWGNPDFTKLCIDKLKFSEIFSGIITVPIFNNKIFPKEFPVLIRETLTSTQSKGVHVVHSEEEFMELWQPGYYWTKFFKAEFELRVQLVLTEREYYVRIYKKVPRESNNISEGNDDFIVSGDNTVWKLRDESKYPKVTTIVQKMCKTIYQMGGRFLGIDMIYVPEIKDYVVLEFNSGPWLTKTSAEWLANIFVENQWSKFQ